MFKRYVIYGMTGLLLEIFWTGLWALMLGNLEMPGFTYLWMFPIYGLGVFMEAIHNRIRTRPMIIRGILWAVLIFSVEYLTGSLLSAFLGSCPWEYRGSRYNVNGYIRLDFAPVWFALGLIFERVHDYLDEIRV